MSKNLSVTFYRKLINFLGSVGLGKIAFIRNINNIIFSQIKQNFMEIEGHKLFLDEYDSLDLYKYGFYEKFETELVKKIIKKDNVVFDVGANIGYSH